MKTTSQIFRNNEFRTAQDARELLYRHGFVSLVAIRGAEHFIEDDGNRRIVLYWDTDRCPEKVSPVGIRYARVRIARNGRRVLDVD
jgi:hypothetical protein